MPVHTVITKNETNGLTMNSMALCEMLYTLDKTMLLNKIGKIKEPTMHMIDKSVMASLGIGLTMAH